MDFLFRDGGCFPSACDQQWQMVDCASNLHSVLVAAILWYVCHERHGSRMVGIAAKSQSINTDASSNEENGSVA